MKLYDLVLDTLKDKPHTRNDDKLLMWDIWTYLGLIDPYSTFHFEDFIHKNCPTPESITRCRRKIQELHPELQAKKIVKDYRDSKANSRGTFVFREKTQPLTEKDFKQPLETVFPSVRQPKTWEDLRKEVEFLKAKATIEAYLKH